MQSNALNPETLQAIQARCDQGGAIFIGALAETHLYMEQTCQDLQLLLQEVQRLQGKVQRAEAQVAHYHKLLEALQSALLQESADPEKIPLINAISETLAQNDIGQELLAENQALQRVVEAAKSLFQAHEEAKDIEGDLPEMDTFQEAEAKAGLREALSQLQ